MRSNVTQYDFFGLHFDNLDDPDCKVKLGKPVAVPRLVSAKPKKLKTPKVNQELAEAFGQTEIPLGLSEILPSALKAPVHHEMYTGYTGKKDPFLDHKGNDYVWTYEDMEKIHDRLLSHSLHLLADRRASAWSVEESIQWFMEPLVEFSPRPFSFEACCRFLNLDARDMQDKLRKMVNKLKRGSL